MKIYVRKYYDITHIGQLTITDNTDLSRNCCCYLRQFSSSDDTRFEKNGYFWLLFFSYWEGQFRDFLICQKQQRIVRVFQKKGCSEGGSGIFGCQHPLHQHSSTSRKCKQYIYISNRKWTLFVELVLNNWTFSFQRIFYQLQRPAMGFPVSLVIPNICMEHFGELAPGPEYHILTLGGKDMW